MMKNYTIGQVAQITALPRKTIRFYEEEGVISKTTRDENDYRLYSEKSVEELKLINQARDLGLPLQEIKKLLNGCSGSDCAHSRDFIESSIDNYLELLSAKIKQFTYLAERLATLKHRLGTSNESCQETYCCNLLHQLVNLPSSGERR